MGCTVWKRKPAGFRPRRGFRLHLRLRRHFLASKAIKEFIQELKYGWHALMIISELEKP